MINYRGANVFCLFIMLLAPSLHTQGQSGSQPRSTAPESNAPRQAVVVTEPIIIKAMWSQQPAERVDPEWLKPRLPKRIVYSAPGMEQIKARKDVVWKRVEGLELKLD